VGWAYGVDRRGRQSGGGKNGCDNYGKNWSDNGKNGGVVKKHKLGHKGASGISRLLGAAKLQSAPDADNPCYAADFYRP